MNSGTYKTYQLDDDNTTRMAVTKVATDTNESSSPPEIPTETSPDSEKVRYCESLNKIKLQESLSGTVGDRSVNEDIICKDEAADEQTGTRIDDANDVAAFEWLDEVSILTDELVDNGLENLCVVFPELGLQDDVEEGSYDELLPDSVEITKWRRNRNKSAENTIEAK